MRKNILACVLAASVLAFGVVGAASAGTVNDNFTITLTVDAMCSIDQAAGDINMVHNAASGTAGSGVTALGITCSQDLPYTVEVDSNVGGNIVLTDASTMKTVGATLKFNDYSTGTYNPILWGSVANGEAFSDIGTGVRKDFSIDVVYDEGRHPASGVYTDTRNIAVNY